jgi:two-component system, NarL family, nitrate/nitrite response regulator NarL
MTGPIERPSRAEPKPARTKPPLRVIVVDDHARYRQGIVRALETAGEIVVGEAGDGRSALELIRTQQPDVALIDVNMPGLDGIDVVGELARQGPDVPVVLLSAFSDEALVSSGLQAGAAAYVTKAADRHKILAAISSAARPENAPRALAAARAGPRHEPS